MTHEFRRPSRPSPLACDALGQEPSGRTRTARRSTEHDPGGMRPDEGPGPQDPRGPALEMATSSSDRRLDRRGRPRAAAVAGWRGAGGRSRRGSKRGALDRGHPVHFGTSSPTSRQRRQYARRPPSRRDTEDAGGPPAGLVADNGIGLGPEDQKRVFEVLPRSRRATFTTSGFGIGLSYVQPSSGHAERAGVSSELGEGSTFFIDSPSRAG